ncbi:DJ-1/PfpI family protein [Paraburkholderia fungorum]|uniref:DJ-1/PfpI family protein n=1 Tax=Paraburkholderia fungorum TaxID=134537 RepID=UPI00402B873C
MKVLAFVFPGFTFVDLAGPMQAFSMLPDYEVQMVWKERGGVMSDCGIAVTASHDFATSWSEPDLLFVPGNTTALFDLLEDEETLRFLASRGEKAQWISSVCSGSLLLGAAGLLDGYRAASYWFVRDELARFGATPVEDRVVIDRNRLTGGGMTAGIDLGLAVLGHMMGEDKGKLFELLFEYAPQPPYGTGRPELASRETLESARALLHHLMPVDRLDRVKMLSR